MAVVLVLASGTAVSLAVTDSASTDAGANVAGLQETTTPEDEAETTTEADEAGDDVETTTPDEGAPGASITFDEQSSDGATLVVDSVTLDEGGFVVVHDSTYQETALASVLGTSVYLEPGTHEDVEITLARPVDETQTLVAMAHLDTNDNRVNDFVLSSGNFDGPYTEDGQAVVDEAEVTVGDETTTPENDETTTPEDEVETTTPEEDDEIETTTPEDEVETTTPEEDDEDEIETPEEPAGQQQFVFKIEEMTIDRWSFVIGDEETPDRTETVSDVTVVDRRVEINVTELLRREAETDEELTTPDPEEAQEQLEENLTGDIETVRIVVENVRIENVTFVVTAPTDMALPEPPMTPEEDDEVETTTPEDEIETTTPEDEVETTTPEEDDEIETTTPEDEIETTTPEDEIETTTPEEDDEVETTTLEEVELESFGVSSLDAPETATVGDNVTVSAQVTNPNDQEATQDVALRLQGTVIERRSITLDAGESTTVSFEVDTSMVSAGEYIHGVYTRDFGALGVITLEEPEPTEDDETTTPDDDEIETTTPEEDDEDEIETTTPEEIETTTPEDEDEEIETTTVEA